MISISARRRVAALLAVFAIALTGSSAAAASPAAASIPGCCK